MTISPTQSPQALHLWGRGSSSNVQKVLWVLDTLNMAYTHTPAGGQFGLTRSSEMLAKNPNALVPTLEDGDFVLWESNTICRYLCNKAAALKSPVASRLYPLQPQARADVERWMDWGSTALAPAITPLFFLLIRTPAEKRDQAAAVVYFENTVRMLQLLESHLGKYRFMCADEVTLADVALGSNLHRYMVLPVEQVGLTRPPMPQVQRWYEALMQLDLYRQHVAITLS
jgi:glutathione S-transferase